MLRSSISLAYSQSMSFCLIGDSKSAKDNATYFLQLYKAVYDFLSDIPVHKLHLAFKNNKPYKNENMLKDFCI